MSLLVWLPLNGNLENQGLSNVTVTNNGATVDNNGKIGKCYSFTDNKYISTNYTWASGNTFSIFTWIKKDTKTGNGTLFRTTTKYSPIIDFNNGTDGSLRIFYWYNSSNYYMMTYPALEANIWYHVGITYDGTTFRFYINGEVVQTMAASSAPYITGTFNIGKADGANFFKGKMNDFRIYDHALSPKEVKELAKGLVLHYRLAGPGQANLLNGNIHLASAWSQENHTVVNYSDSNFTGLKITATQANGRIYNNVSNLWITNNAKYTVSFWAKSDTAGTTIDCSRSLRDYSPTFTLDTDWKYYSGIITTTETSAGGTLSIRIKQASRVVYIANIKVENGAIATPFVSPSNSSIYSAMGYNNNIEYDCAGYQRNGTKSGNITWDIDTPRYTTSYKFGTDINLKTNLNFNNIQFENMESGTFSFWIKFNKEFNHWTHYVFFADGFNWTGKGSDFFIVAKNGDQSSVTQTTTINIDCCSYSTRVAVTLDTWYHIVTVWDAKTYTIKKYVDGVLKSTHNDSTNKRLDTYRSRHNYHGIGNFFNSAQYGGDFSVSDFRIYSTALSDADIQELYHTAGWVDPGVAAAYEFKED